MTSTLDTRRDKAATAASAAEEAQAGVTELENRLKTNALLKTKQAQALRNAEAEVARLKRSLKAAAKEKVRLSDARKKAAAQAAKVQEKQKAAEAKYDKALLADLLRREKERDRAGQQEPAKPAGRGTRATAKPAPEKPDPATTTATRTAARRTAARAR